MTSNRNAPLPPIRKPGAQPGNHNAYKHGRYARTGELATQLFFPAGSTNARRRHVIVPRESLRSKVSQRVTGGIPEDPPSGYAGKTIFVEGVSVRVPTSAEIARLETLSSEEFLAEVKRLWVIMAFDALKFPGLPLKDVLYLVRKIIKWRKL